MGRCASRVSFVKTRIAPVKSDSIESKSDCVLRSEAHPNRLYELVPECHVWVEAPRCKAGHMTLIISQRTTPCNWHTLQLAGIPTGAS